MLYRNNLWYYNEERYIGHIIRTRSLNRIRVDDLKSFYDIERGN